ncbi:Uncharacterised protein [Mycobacterium tuberculosis]|uniref:Uncharacterized protein n=1 Tax=Mycobacterium tuberculosis TaxID=1773 RepID=A0A916L8Z2_MYCTX|nr:Uncharacterised protein [Mycobacterium tuberculosis]COX21868.1 Uncharacterised protein [Mycobacterium tuberculosis]COX21950.1 Uncharacterised protein [Mycobacterium tuberculosis]
MSPAWNNGIEYVVSLSLNSCACDNGSSSFHVTGERRCVVVDFHFLTYLWRVWTPLVSHD